MACPETGKHCRLSIDFLFLMINQKQTEFCYISLYPFLPNSKGQTQTSYRVSFKIKACKKRYNLLNGMFYIGHKKRLYSRQLSLDMIRQVHNKNVLFHPVSSTNPLFIDHIRVFLAQNFKVFFFPEGFPSLHSKLSKHHN